MFTTIICLLSISVFCRSAVINFKDVGGIVNDDSTTTVWKNGRLLNTTLAGMKPFDTLVFPDETFYLMGGIKAAGLSSVTFQFDGHLIFSNNTNEWPTDENGDVLECIYMYNISNVTFTSSKKDMKGVLDGNGLKWWGIPGLGYLRHTENRPRLLNIESSSNILVENILFLNSPYWTFWVHDVDGLEVRFSEISARRTDIDYHDLVDMTAFNTDGFDVTGRNVWIHDCEVWTQDDTIAVKDGSENMLFERITASGVGLTIGSIGSSSVRNITFRDCYMPNTYKGIYLKFRDGDGGLIEDVTFENIVIDEPTQWPIWIGPAQQSDSRRLCAAHPCSICWPFLPSAECNAPLSQYRNILLKNITINSPKLSPGVIFANPETPMDGVVFEDVVFNAPGENPWNDAYYYCDGVKGGVAKGTTWPVPPCFEDQTTRTL